jgi:ribosome maturation factor RimP
LTIVSTSRQGSWRSTRSTPISLPECRFAGDGGRPFVLEFCGFRSGDGPRAHFLFVRPVSERDAWIRGALEGLGYELVDVESSRSGLLRVFIDSPRGINVEDCARVSNHLTRAFAVEGIDYERLEVSSPGLDRPLKRLGDFERFAGRDASVKLKLPRDGRRRFEGRLVGVEGGRIVLDVEGQRQELAFEDIDRARLVPDV